MATSYSYIVALVGDKLNGKKLLLSLMGFPLVPKPGREGSSLSLRRRFFRAETS